MRIFRAGNKLVVTAGDHERAPGVELMAGEMMPKEPCKVTLKPRKVKVYFTPLRLKPVPWGGFHWNPSYENALRIIEKREKERAARVG